MSTEYDARRESEKAVGIDVSDGWTINLVCCTQVILDELSWPQTTRKSVGLTYAMAMKSQAQGADKPDWPTINNAILKRWGHRGLETVKRRAWRLIERKEQP